MESFPRGWMESMETSMENDMEGMDLVKSSSNVSELMNFDAYAEWCKMFPSFSGSNFTDQYSGISVVDGDKLEISSDDDDDDMMMMIPKSPCQSLSEKMLRAMNLLKEWCGEGLLAQLWVPTWSGNKYVLTTSEQPYLLDQNLMGYREVSRLFTFSAESETGPFTGLPGRVFVSRVPEWTSNVMYYNKAEYLRIQHAYDHKVRGSIALPIFEDDSCQACSAVLELVTVKEKPNFKLEMESICHALEAVNLRSKGPPRLYPQSLSENQRTALAEVTDILRAVCHAHKLPLALTWIPCNYSEGADVETLKIRSNGNKSPNEKNVLCVEKTACYVNNKDMESFVHVCAEHYLEEGKGIVGKALQSNHPFFYPDVKEYHVDEYPLVHHARKFGLNAAIAIRLRSTYTYDVDYILEFFLPVDMKGSTEQQLLLRNLSVSMQRLCKSLRTVSDVEFLRVEDSKVLSQMSCEQSIIDRDETYVYCSADNASESKDGGVVDDCSYQQPIAGPRKQTEKKRSTSEKHVSLSVIQQHFSGSLKAAARSMGVCPTTLKRICRQHGISRWPSRKINKVNRSLWKIQSMLDSVEGVKGGLKFDPITGGFMAANSSTQEFDLRKHILSPDIDRLFSSSNLETRSSCTDTEINVVKIEEEPILNTVPWTTTSSKAPESSFLTAEGSHVWVVNNSAKADASRSSNSTIAVEHNQSTSSGMTDSSGSRMTNDSSLSSRSFGERHYPEMKGDSGSKITVKATYKEDTVRFKFEHSAGCMQLYEEVGKRFNMQIWQFQLKYVDDEEEWVILENDSDLVECFDVLNFMGKNSLKLMVRDARLVQ